MLNYFNFDKRNNRVLLTNDFGKYQFVSTETFDELLKGCVSEDNPDRELLIHNGFIFDGSNETFIKSNVPWIQSMKGYCLCGTALHIFAITNKCNLNCVYCQAHSKSSLLNSSMSKETGRKAIEFALQSPNKSLTFEFQGGEPLLNFDVVKDMILYSREINDGKNIEYTIVTNLLHMTEDKLDFLVENGVHICTSLDGPAIVHDYNRPFGDGTQSHYKVVSKIIELKNKGINVNAIQTTTKHSLKFPKEIIDQYMDLDINNIFLRPLTPLGMAEEYWDNVGYSAEEFMEFYREAFKYIMEINMKGIYFSELHASYFLKKILHNYSDNYMELRSPCGAGIGQMSYYHDGSVYTCDEGRMLSEMGDNSFLLGNVYENSFNNVVSSPVCAAVCKASIVETLPKCSGCVYQPYCGVCPVVNYAATNSLYDKNSKDFRCSVYKGIMDLIFEILDENDEKKVNILKSWIS